MGADDLTGESQRLHSAEDRSELDASHVASIRSLLRFACQLCSARGAAMSLVDREEEYVLAAEGTLAANPKFSSGIWKSVTHDLDIVQGNHISLGPNSFASIALLTEAGLPFGSFSVFIPSNRELSLLQRNGLVTLADQARTHLSLQREIRRLERGFKIERTVESGSLAEAEFLAVITDRLPVRVAYLDPNMRYVFLNGEYERQFGFAPREAWGRTVEEIVGAPVWLATKRYFEEALAGESNTQEFTLPYSFGDRRIEARFVPDFGLSGEVRGVVMHAVDVSARYNAELALRHSEDRFRTVFQSAPDAIVVMDPSLTIQAWNPAAEVITRWSGDDAIGNSGHLIFTEEDQLSAVPLMEAETAAREGKVISERWYVRKDGSRFWGSGTMNAFHDTNGSVRGYLKVFRDATERYEIETKIRDLNLELEARVKERTQELEDAIREAEGFNYSIAHDLRAPLRAIVSTSSMLIEGLADKLDPSSKKQLERQIFNATRLSRLIDELLRLSRLARVEVVRQPLNMTTKALTVAAELNPGRTVEVQEGMVAQGDPALIRSVFENLIGNAFKFSQPESIVRVGYSQGEFWVKDEGIGFDMRYAAKLFLPFERLVTEAEFEGTGIGLANVERIVRRHGGKVWAESEIGKGSTFFFTLGQGAS